MAELSRRSLLASGLAGGLVLAFHIPVRATDAAVEPPDDVAGQFAPNAFIRIDHSGRTILIMPQVEMGQGVYTSIPMILAEELDADFSKVVLEHAPPNDRLYANPMLGYQVTGNSNSVRSFWKPLRTAGATARAMLIQAAAEQWGVEPASCTAADGEVVHGETGRKLSYGALVDAANTQIPPKEVRFKDPNEFVLIGKPLKRLDTPDKVNGKAVFGIDVMLPGMKFATLKACPVFGGKVGRVDDSAAKRIPGVQKVVVLDDLVAVVGDHMWAAQKGIEALIVDWEEGPNADLDLDEIWRIYALRARRTVQSQSREAISRRAFSPAKNSKRRTSSRFWRMRRWSRSTPRFTSNPIPAKSGLERRCSRACSRKPRRRQAFRLRK